MSVYLVKLQCSGSATRPHKTVPIRPPLWFTTRGPGHPADLAGGNEVLIDETALTEEETRLAFGTARRRADPSWSDAYSQAGRSRHVRRCNVCHLTLEALPQSLQSFLSTLVRSSLTNWRVKGEHAELTLELPRVIDIIEGLRT